MSYAMLPVMILAVLLFLFFRGMREEKRKKEALRAKLQKDCGRPPQRYRREMAERQAGAEENGEAACGDRRIGGEKNGGQAVWKETGGGAGSDRGTEFFIDRITWKELEMETVFLRLDYTLSQAGTETLYKALHCPAGERKEAEKWDAIAGYFMSHPKERIRLQEILAWIGREKAHSFAVGQEKQAEYRKKILVREYAGWAAYLLAFLAAVRTGGAGVCLLVCVMAVQMVSYFRKRAGILPHVNHIAWLLRMIRGVERLYGALPEEVCRETEKNLHVDAGACLVRLRTLRRHSFWVMQCGGGGSSPLSLLGDYIRMLFHTDIVQFILLQNKIAALRQEIADAYAFTGYLDTCISIGMYRMSLKAYCLPELYTGQEKGELHVLACVHPLLEEPVANSMITTAGRGVLLTGSNASGKSTFLKTIAVNLLLAQTIHTALAAEFSAPFCRIYTAMADGGDIREGRSSYMAEILSLQRIIEAGKTGGLPVCCFIDEILRGTGTVERIAASASILGHVRPPQILCFAATHDRELTYLLEEAYDNYYFTEEVRDGDMIFSYRLKPGRADQSNAIRLLSAVGYDREIVEEAARQAAYFRQHGEFCSPAVFRDQGGKA